VNFEINPPNDDEIEITLLGGGVGECIVIHAGNKNWYIVDSFLNESTGNPIGLDYLECIGVNLQEDVKLIVATHWHDDHVKGIFEILKKCEQSKFLVSMATNKEEFLALIAQDEAQTANLKALSSGVNEFYQCFTYLIENGQIDRRLWAIQDRQFTPDGHISNFYSLSPSDREISLAVQMFVDLAVDQGEQINPIPKRNPNHTSIVLGINVGDFKALLGADLENITEPGCGWEHLVTNSTLIRGNKYSLIKIPHHGSSGSHHDGLWQKHIETSNHSLVSTFTKSHLPRVEDVDRILGLSNSAYSTGNPRLTKKARKIEDRAAEKIISRTTKRFVKLGTNVGQVTFRKSTSSGAETIQKFGSALHLKDLKKVIGS